MAEKEEEELSHLGFPKSDPLGLASCQPSCDTNYGSESLAEPALNPLVLSPRRKAQRSAEELERKRLSNSQQENEQCSSPEQSVATMQIKMKWNLREEFCRKYKLKKSVQDTIKREFESNQQVLQWTVQKEKEELTHLGLPKWDPLGLSGLPKHAAVDTSSTVQKETEELPPVGLTPSREAQRTADHLQRRKLLEEIKRRDISFPEQDEYAECMFANYPEDTEKEFIEWLLNDAYEIF